MKSRKEIQAMKGKDNLSDSGKTEIGRKMSFIYIGNPHKLQIMRLTQKKLASGAHGRKVLELAKHCFANLVIRIDLVKLPDIFQISNREALTI